MRYLNTPTGPEESVTSVTPSQTEADRYAMDHWDSTPRIAFLSPEPGSGKSRALEVTEPLVPRPVHGLRLVGRM